MKDRRKLDQDNWRKIKKFINESREYRLADNVKQDYQVKSIDSLNDKVKIQNGRIGYLEDWKQQVIGKKDLINFILSVSAVIAAIAVFFIKK